jgi:hypothetical protein
MENVFDRSKLKNDKKIYEKLEKLKSYQSILR